MQRQPVNALLQQLAWQFWDLWSSRQVATSLHEYQGSTGALKTRGFCTLCRLMGAAGQFVRATLVMYWHCDTAWPCTDLSAAPPGEVGGVEAWWVVSLQHTDILSEQIRWMEPTAAVWLQWYLWVKTFCHQDKFLDNKSSQYKKKWLFVYSDSNICILVTASAEV